jgi:hypothetical protein
MKPRRYHQQRCMTSQRPGKPVRKLIRRGSNRTWCCCLDTAIARAGEQDHESLLNTAALSHSSSTTAKACRCSRTAREQHTTAAILPESTKRSDSQATIALSHNANTINSTRVASTHFQLTRHDPQTSASSDVKNASKYSTPLDSVSRLSGIAAAGVLLAPRSSSIGIHLWPG